ncbi:hypothetical protein [Saccharicrinis sp. 156]|uniref:hypothetical protein n=1 Tax=Saccharicrinis sp. 156 TaxID=3417574 RepID=UPI003D34EC6B
MQIYVAQDRARSGNRTSAPVWVDGLTSSPSGYCCNNEGPSVGKPLCVLGETGCYVSLGSVTEGVEPKPGFFSNNHDCPVGSCGLDFCVSGQSFDLCEKSSICDASVSSISLNYFTNLYECNDGSLVVDDVVVGSYPSLVDVSSCDTSSCDIVTERVCELTNPSSCWAACDSSNPDSSSFCELVCDDSAYTCSDEVTYRNCQSSSCVYDISNVVQSRRYFVDLSQSFSCETDFVSDCSGISCSYDASLSNYVSDVVCEDEVFCSSGSCDGSDDFVCLPEFTGAVDLNGDYYTRLVNSSSGFVSCSSGSTIDLKGQPFCPVGFVYVSSAGRCEIDFSGNCDAGFPSDIVCDDLLEVSTGDLFDLYRSSCFLDSYSGQVLGSDGLYEQSCCLDYRVGSYDVYTIDTAETNIRIY